MGGTNNTVVALPTVTRILVCGYIFYPRYFPVRMMYILKLELNYFGALYSHIHPQGNIVDSNGPNMLNIIPRFK